MPSKLTTLPVLSDHAYQSRSFRAVNPKNNIQTELTIGSWNIQDKCRSKQTQGGFYANNPYDIDEDPISFDIRKRAQMQKIVENIKQPGGDDVIFLQEIDFLTDKTHKKLKNELIDILKQNGYQLILSDIPTTMGYSQQPLAILYNKTKLKPVRGSNKGVFPSPATAQGIQKYRGFETSFTLYNNPSTTIAVTNLHLLYAHDYKSEIEDYQIEKQREGVFSIMGGDTNNIQGLNLNSALVNWHRATNISSDPNTNQLTTKHTDPTLPSNARYQKAYDCFFGVPPTGCYLESQLTSRSEEVHIDQKTKQAIFTPIHASERPISISRVGERWRRGKHIIKELEAKYQQQATERDKILDEIHSVIQWKKLNANTCLSNSDIKTNYFNTYPTRTVPVLAEDAENASILSHQANNSFNRGHKKPVTAKNNIKINYDHYIDKTKRNKFAEGRPHTFYAQKQNSLLRGDTLKSAILDQFSMMLNNCQSTKELKETIKKIKGGNDYKILATGQDLTTRIFNGLIKTSSSIAFDDMCQQKKQELSSSQSPKRKL
jgi:hypothetical protein